MDSIERRILEIIDLHAEELYDFADDIFRHAEPGFAEWETSRKMKEAFALLDLPIEEGLALTGVKGVLSGKEEGPTLALIGELDGIRCPSHPSVNPENNISHACGHHAQLTALFGAAIALSSPEVKEKLAGKAVFFAVPAEECAGPSEREHLRREGKIEFVSGGKSELVRIGAFDGIDAALTTHVHMADCSKDLLLGNVASNGFLTKRIEIKGKAAHAALAPHAGINALNAASLGMSALGMLRETFEEKDYVRIHPIIVEGGQAINVVPDRVVLETQVRGATIEAIEKASEKTDRAFAGGAYAIGAKAEIKNYAGYLPVMAREADAVLDEAAKLLSKEITIAHISSSQHNTASTDVGDLTHLMPVLNFTHGGTKGALHSADFEVVDREKAYLLPAKMMALTAYRLLKDGGAELQNIIDEFKPYFTKEEYIEYMRK